MRYAVCHALCLRFRPQGLRFRPVGLRFRPVSLRFRPQGLRSSVFVFDTSIHQVGGFNQTTWLLGSPFGLMIICIVSVTLS